MVACFGFALAGRGTLFLEDVIYERRLLIYVS